MAPTVRYRQTVEAVAVIDDHETFGPFRIERDPTMPPGVVGLRTPTHSTQRRLVTNGQGVPYATELLLLHHRRGGGMPVVIARAHAAQYAPLNLPPTTVCRECGALVAANGAQLTAATNPETGRVVAIVTRMREAQRIRALGPPNTMGATAGQVAVGPGIYVTPVGHDSTPGQDPGEGGDQG